MSFEASVFNVMIASPSDVPGERQAVRDILYEWNVIHADERKQVLLPIGWETHSAPDMSGPSQPTINKQMLFNCDLLVGVFWTRIGTPTAEYPSGTVEEFERHVAAGKPAMLYFSESPVQLHLVDIKQYEQLQEFKKNCRERGLYEGFVSADDFKNKFRRQLQIILKEYFKPKNNYNSEVEIISIVTDEELANMLSVDEQKLLKAASLDKLGKIHRYSVNAGTYIEVSRVHIIKEQTAREISRWDSVLDSLSYKGYIKPVGDKGDYFKITDAGFKVADSIIDSGQ